VYAYSYQVADDQEQTYIAKKEDRDGADVTGEYSYVDPNGSLITVRYTADSNGYVEERDVQQNFVLIRSRPSVSTSRVSTSTAAVAPAVIPAVRRAQTSTTTNVDSVVNTVSSRIRPAVERVVTTQSSSSANSDDLVARIVARLTPFIEQTVSNTLEGQQQQQQVVTTRRVVQAEPVVTTRRVVAQTLPVTTASETQAIFGTGGANNIAFSSPNTEFSFDL